MAAALAVLAQHQHGTTDATVDPDPQGHPPWLKPPPAPTATQAPARSPRSTGPDSPVAAPSPWSCW
ncbi:hypothetical protein QJS66_19345 [Kocuria rhizophila]|nr:hypothetical protein QJS66_19345 [Kocuria rhizophila]